METSNPDFILLTSQEVFDEKEEIRSEYVPRSGSSYVPHGRCKVLRDDGTVSTEISYKHGIAHGRYLEIAPNGAVVCEGQFTNGKRDGDWHFYRRDGSLLEKVKYEQGKEITPFTFLLPEER